MVERPGEPAQVLAGWTVVITRPRPQAERLAENVKVRGGQAVIRPLIEVHLRPQALLPWVTRFSEYDGILLTSANAARVLTEATQQAGVAPANGPPCYAIGEATRRVAASAGWTVKRLPGTRTADTLAEALLSADGRTGPRRWLFPHGNLAESTLAERLGRAGDQVDAVTCYETLDARIDPGEWRLWLSQPRVWVVFYSPSAVRSLVRQLADAAGDGSSRPQARFACIGPTTARACTAYRLPVDCVPDDSHDAALLTAIERSTVELSRSG
jgi:uroporphyrinogen-III synthase